MSNDDATRQAAKKAVTRQRRAVIYARVSSERQAGEDRYSLATQIEVCRKYAEANGAMIVAELIDDCSGAIPIMERPNGRKLYELVDSSAVDAIILFTLDRTARDEKVLEYILFKSYLSDREVELHYSDTGLDPYTMEGNLVGYIKAHAASEERKKIRERTTRGKNGKAQNGKMVLPVWPPYGYLRQNGKLGIRESETNIVRLIFHWYLYGDGQSSHLSMKAIADKLTGMGLPTPQAGRLSPGSFWRSATIDRILSNEIYIGHAYFGMTRMENGHLVHQPHEKWIPVDVPELAIIEPATFQAAQETKKHNKKMSKRNRKREYLLTGFIRCGMCGRVMCGHTTTNKKDGKEYPGYKETGALYPGEKVCPYCHKQIPMVLADTAVWNWLVGLFEDTDNLRKKLNEIAERKESDVEPMRKQLDIIADAIAKAEKKVNRLASAIAELEDDEDNSRTALEALKSQLKIASKEEADFTQRRDTITQELAQQELLTPEAIDSFAYQAGQFFEGLLDATYEGKRAWFERLNLQVAVRRDKQTGRWLDVSCELSAKSLPLDPAGKALIEGIHPESDLSVASHKT